MGLLDRFVTPKHLREEYEFDNSISQEELLEIAQKHVSHRMRRKAIGKIRNRDILVKLSKSNNLDAYSAILDNPFVNDEMIINILSSPAIHEDPMLCQVCVKKIESESIIDEIARSRLPDYIRYHAIERTNNKQILHYASLETIRDPISYLSKPSEIARTAQKRLKEFEEKTPSRNTEKSEGAKTTDEILDECVEELLRIYGNNPKGFLSDSPSAQPVKDIGEKLNATGGMDLMLRAHEIFSARERGIGLARNLEMVWDGIGNWRG